MNVQEVDFRNLSTLIALVEPDKVSDELELSQYNCAATITKSSDYPRQLLLILPHLLEIQRLKHYILQLESQLTYEHAPAQLGNLVSGIIHNIGTPLTGIIGYAELMKASHSESSDVERILKQAQRIDAIIKNFIAKRRYDQDRELTLNNINELVKIEVEFLQAHHTFKHNIDTKIEYAKGIPLVYIPYGDLSQSFLIYCCLSLKFQAVVP